MIIDDLEKIPHGDMPGDKIKIDECHIKKAEAIYPELRKLSDRVMKENDKNRVVISVCGGSGVGKSEIASLLSYYFEQEGINSYTLSGDNYPRRIPMYNDAERIIIFRNSATRGMINEETYSKERALLINNLQNDGKDASKTNCEQFDWYSSYIDNGRKGLSEYLGTDNEINFDEINSIINAFKSGKSKIWLKRMGRTAAELWYDEVDLSDTKVLIIEWTHGNSDYLHGVDIPVLLNSTPEETLEHRRLRNRDGATDSPFTTMVLEIEQKLLMNQAHKAKIIITKDGELISYEQYKGIMNINGNGVGTNE